MAEITWDYEKLDENYEVKIISGNLTNDPDGKITGHIVMNVKAWFDENPEERKRLGYIKHIHHDTKDIEYNKQSQYLVQTVRSIDPWTVEDEYHVMDKSEEMMLFEEMLSTVNGSSFGNITWTF